MTTPRIEVTPSSFTVDDGLINDLLDLSTYGQIDGSHHKNWVIDQMVRTMLGDNYETFVNWYEDEGEYEWDTGIAP